MTAWRALGEAPPETPVLGRYHPSNAESNGWAEHVVWFYDGEWRSYPETSGLAYVVEWRAFGVDPRIAAAAHEGLGSLLLEVQQECVSLRVALATARDQFKDYERQHRAKGTPEADAKAEVNAGMVRMCQEAIDGSRKAVPSVMPS